MQALSQIFKSLMHIVCAEIAAGDANRPKSPAKNHALGADLLRILLPRLRSIGRILCLLRISSSGKVKRMPDAQEDAIIVTHILLRPPVRRRGNAPYFETGASGLPTNNGEKVCVLHIG
ncbi:hypothetical protein [Collimonas fungivorans]|uniref:hypothetical protein n=1 Tax=Collimonas fungivorans TaxID=158899 RepID=UPI001237200E|nr:hypothetical protein [Collimonas fungivorans]